MRLGRDCEARALRARKTRTPRFTDFFTDFEKKTDCFAVYLRTSAQKLVLISCRVARTYVSVSDTRVSYGFLMSLTIGLIFTCA